MSSLIFYNQDYHCVLHQVLPIFLYQEERTFFYQDSKPGRAAIMANQFYPYWGGERLGCKCSDGGGGEFPAKKYFWQESMMTNPVIRQKIWLNKNANGNVENLVQRGLSSMQDVLQETSPRSVLDVRSRSVAVNSTVAEVNRRFNILIYIIILFRTHCSDLALQFVHNALPVSWTNSLHPFDNYVI